MKNWNWVLICFIIALTCQLAAFGVHLYTSGYDTGYIEGKLEVEQEQNRIDSIFKHKLDSVLDLDAEGKFQDDKFIILTK